MQQGKRKPRIGILLGDPSGIGPELVAKLLAGDGSLNSADVVVIGDRGIYQRGVEIAGVDIPEPPFIEFSTGSSLFPQAKASAEAGAYSIGSLRLALDLIRKGDLDGFVYAPLNKQAMKLAGLKHEDELHFFAEYLGHNGTVSEINVCDKLWTSRVTSHVPLRCVADLITVDKICAAALLLHDAISAAGVESPRLAIAGLNPHAGEGGLLGSEEIEVIAPAVERLRSRNLAVEGPLPADTLFIAARRGGFDGVVTMYHDQGQIALKLLGFERGVTVAGGLPAVIATPAHGTAFDIAGKGIANVGALRQAFQLVCDMSSRRYL